jgi:hypothetical protein
MKIKGITATTIEKSSMLKMDTHILYSSIFKKQYCIENIMKI